MTEYVVLKKKALESGSTGWVAPILPASPVSARSARAAVQEIAGKLKAEGEGEFVAIPVRSFQPMTVKVETKTALKFS